MLIPGQKHTHADTCGQCSVSICCSVPLKTPNVSKCTVLSDHFGVVKTPCPCSWDNLKSQDSFHSQEVSCAVCLWCKQTNHRTTLMWGMCIHLKAKINNSYQPCLLSSMGYLIFFTGCPAICFVCMNACINVSTSWLQLLWLCACWYSTQFCYSWLLMDAHM